MERIKRSWERRVLGYLTYLLTTYRCKDLTYPRHTGQHRLSSRPRQATSYNPTEYLANHDVEWLSSPRCYKIFIGKGKETNERVLVREWMLWDFPLFLSRVESSSIRGQINKLNDIWKIFYAGKRWMIESEWESIEKRWAYLLNLFLTRTRANELKRCALNVRQDGLACLLTLHKSWTTSKAK